jgi:predicted transcriptional regulator
LQSRTSLSTGGVEGAAMQPAVWPGPEKNHPSERGGRKPSPMNDNPSGGNFIELTADIVSAYVSNNSVPASDLSNLINQVHVALVRVSSGQSEVTPEPLKPAVAVKKSITPEYIVCLEDGKKFKSLKRHLRTQYNMTPEQYREKWALPSYAAARSQLAKQMGLGQQRRRRK